jgi:hypothetical protein
MDTKLENGDFALGSNGRPMAVSGVEELLQRAKIRLTVPLGSFACNPELGSRLWTLTGNEPDRDARALSMAQDALRLLPQLEAQSAQFVPGSPASVKAGLLFENETYEIEVKLPRTATATL